MDKVADPYGMLSMEEPLIIAEYLQEVFRPKLLKIVVDKAIKALTFFEKDHPFDAIAFSGVSGASLAFPISLLTGKNLICVRKDGTSHSERRVVGMVNAKRYVIVDDQVDSGATIELIKKSIAKDCPNANLVGIYIWGYVTSPWRENNKDILIKYPFWEEIEGKI